MPVRTVEKQGFQKLMKVVDFWYKVQYNQTFYYNSSGSFKQNVGEQQKTSFTLCHQSWQFT